MADFADMRVALRVLTAIVKWREPNPEDVARLRVIAPHAASWPADDLACEVVRQTLEQRAKAASK